VCEEMHPVVQLDYVPGVLLISTLARTMLCFIEDTYRFVQVGQSERKRSLSLFIIAIFIARQHTAADARY